MLTTTEDAFCILLYRQDSHDATAARNFLHDLFKSPFNFTLTNLLPFHTMNDKYIGSMKIAAPPSIQDHIISTYSTIRVGIAVLAIALPIVLVVVGLIYKVELQESLSAYYHAYQWLDPKAEFLEAGKGVMRNWFVGILWAIGVFLILYPGFGRRENIALNIGGILLIAVAMFPMGWICIPTNSCETFSIHGTSALLFFLSISYVCIFRSGDTLNLITKPAEKAFYKRTYRIIGILMAVFPITVTILNLLHISPFGPYITLVLEAVGIWTFAAYWILKSWEISKTGADLVAVADKFSRPPQRNNVVAWFLDTAPLRTVPDSEN